MEGRNYDGLNFDRLDLSAGLLGGYKLHDHLDLNLRYSHGFRNIFKEDPVTRTTNRFLNFSVLYTFYHQ